MTDILFTDDNGDRDADIQTDSGVLHPSMIALMVLGVATLVIVVILLLIRWQSQRFQRGAWNTTGRPLQPQQLSVLTFTNPNYTQSTPWSWPTRKRFLGSAGSTTASSSGSTICW